MPSEPVYLGLGSNLGGSLATLKNALTEIRALPQVSDLTVSGFYQTTPVSPLPQPDFLNAAASFNTSFSPEELLCELQKIEKKLGKIPKKKEEPRVLDLDILLFGSRWINTPTLKVPHPELLNRLFVLTPLADLTETIVIVQPDGLRVTINLKEYLSQFPNLHGERVEIKERSGSGTGTHTGAGTTGKRN
jgi:2-amino-4-hydroxy-6-hydroxymethyldihydropteridine diphosphokinase